MVNNFKFCQNLGHRRLAMNKQNDSSENPATSQLPAPDPRMVTGNPHGVKAYPHEHTSSAQRHHANMWRKYLENHSIRLAATCLNLMLRWLWRCTTRIYFQQTLCKSRYHHNYVETVYVAFWWKSFTLPTCDGYENANEQQKNYDELKCKVPYFTR